MSDTNTTVEQTLQAFSRYNFDPYCVGHLFVHRDFGGGVLGLAWVGDASTLGNAGGICEKQVTAKDLGKVWQEVGCASPLSLTARHSNGQLS